MKKLLAALAIITAISVGITFYAPISEVFKGLTVLPAVGSLFAALFQLVRDHASHERELQLQRKEQLFNLGAASHMSNVVFDKHICFCEEYMAEVHSTISVLVGDGVTVNINQNANKLFSIRQHYSAWITDDISASLESFEEALKDVAAIARRIESAPDGSKQLENQLKEGDEVRNKLLGALFNKNLPKDNDIEVESIKAKLREILGIEKMLKIRQWIIDNAEKSINVES